MFTTKLCSSEHDGDVPAYTYTVCDAVITVPTAIGPTPFGELK